MVDVISWNSIPCVDTVASATGRAPGLYKNSLRLFPNVSSLGNVAEPGVTLEKNEN